VFNLVKYRKLFILLSLIVIVPGLLSLCFFWLNLGVDFAGGASVELRPQRAFSDPTQVQALLKSYNLKSTQITLGKNNQLGATAWVRLNTQVNDSYLQNNVEGPLTKKYGSQLQYTQTVIKNNGNPYTLLTITAKNVKLTSDEIKSTLANLPAMNNSNTSTLSSAATPTATATATSSKKTTPVPAPGTSNTTPVSVADVQVNDSSNQTISILTQTQLSTSQPTGSGVVNMADVQGTFLQNNGPYFSIVTNTQIGPAVAGRTVVMAILAVIAASICITLFVWFSFRKVPKALRYGLCAIIALLHDALVVLGIFSILGHFFGVQIDSLFITGLLTVIGFSVHDTIVVFDRIRENMQRHTIETFEDVVNTSLVQTMARSLNTSLTVLFTMLALTLFTGIGTSIHTFTLTLLIGIFSGTYSSIFNASMLLVMWEKGEFPFGRSKSNQEIQPSKRNREVRELARSRG
jgi:preprotein translocase SecF subunit